MKKDIVHQRAIGSRLKQLSERLMQDVSRVYKEEGIDFDPSFFMPYRLLKENGSMSASDMAPALSISQPASSQVIRKMIAKGLLLVKGSKEDKRVKILSLSKKGLELYPRLEVVWKRIHEAHKELEKESGIDLRELLDRTEAALDRKDLYSRITKK